MSQVDAILQALQAGRILTPMDALNDPSIRSFKLATRISELEREGYQIEKSWVATASGKRVMSYKIKAQEPANYI